MKAYVFEVVFEPILAEDAEEALKRLQGRLNGQEFRVTKVHIDNGQN